MHLITKVEDLFEAFLLILLLLLFGILFADFWDLLTVYALADCISTFLTLPI